jgi:hypothetical protein
MFHRANPLILRTLVLGAIIGSLIACANPGITPTPTLTMPTTTPTTTPTIAPTPSPTATTTATATLTPTPKPEASLFDALFQPLANEAKKRREQRGKSDPEYARRVSKPLNANRVNILLFGYGETHEPPVTERAIIGSHTIISFDTQRRAADLISITHDTRAPEVERKLGISGKPKSATRIDQAFIFGGFDLQRQTLENATGLSIDFQVAFDDVVIKEFVDSVYGGVEVNVPQTFEVHPFYLNGKKYPKGTFTQGRQKLNGTQVIQFIKTVPVAAVAYDVALEHNLRKYIIFEALLETLKAKSSDPIFWLNAGKFTAGEIKSGTLAYDFDHTTLVKNQVGEIVVNLGKYAAADHAQKSSAVFPRFNKRKYMVDKTQGDGGVRWVNPNVEDPYMRADVKNGVYPNYDMEVPYNGNPYSADLANDYWCSTRSLVQTALIDYPPLPCFQSSDPKID